MNRARIAALLLAVTPFAQAHKASDAYVTLRVDGAVVDARMDIALRDIDRDLDLDTDADDQLSWKEVRTRWADIATLARDGIRLSADGARCTPEAAAASTTATNAPALASHSDGRYAVVRTQWRCAAPVQSLSIDYQLFDKTDPTHRGIVRVSRAGATFGADTPQLAVLSPGNGWHRFALPPLPAAPPQAASRVDGIETPATVRQPQPEADAERPAADDAPDSSLAGFVRAGIHHILIGYDHILFLLSLLLPAVWIRSAMVDPRTGATRTRWLPSQNLRLALANVLKVVTAFTVAHSITLALSVLDVVDPPSRWVESVIAASVVLAALNNIWPVVSEARWKLTFVFGLVHGFGFASALKDAGLAKGALVAPLVGFNVGVEIGQLCIVAVVLPIAWSMRGTRTYRGAFAAGSLAIAAVAGLWLVQRAFDLSLIAG
ncbi:MAG: HupE/UreJ family protein [Vitreoscilla sp.]